MSSEDWEAGYNDGYSEGEADAYDRITDEYMECREVLSALVLCGLARQFANDRSNPRQMVREALQELEYISNLYEPNSNDEPEWLKNLLLKIAKYPLNLPHKGRHEVRDQI